MGQDETKRRARWDGKSRILGGTSGPWRRAHRRCCKRGEAGMGRGCPMHRRWAGFPGQPGRWMLHWCRVPAEPPRSIFPGKRLQGPCVQGSHHPLLALKAPSTCPQLPRPTRGEVVGEEQPSKDSCPRSHSTPAHPDPSSGTAGRGCDETRGTAPGRPASSSSSSPPLRHQRVGAR